MKEAVIVSAVRTAVAKGGRGALKNVHPVEYGASVVQEAIQRAGLEAEQIEDIIIGCAMPEGEQGMNMARLISLRAGLPVSVPALTINRYCASGLQSMAYAAQQIRLGLAEVILAGGVESMSRVPMGGHKIAPNPWLVEHYPESYMSMGHTAEEVARRFQVTREDQDAFALRSHQRAAKALQEGKFREEIMPIKVHQYALDEQEKENQNEYTFEVDEGVRANTSIRALAKLRPVFHPQGSVTAGNASQVSDGAAAVLLMSQEKAEQLGLKPLAKFKAYAVSGVEPEIMGIGPVQAIPKALQQVGISIGEVGLFELNEAFASQAIQVIRELQLDEEKVNVNGGAIALGHPLGCTGTKLSISLIYEMRRRKERFGVVSMCIGGGMGAAGVLELVE